MKIVSLIRGYETYSEEMAHHIGLDHSNMTKLVRDISGGAQRLLSIAMTLIGDFPLIILDEPTANLDLVSRNKVWNFIYELKKSRTILLTTQNIEEAEYLSDHMCLLKDGSLIMEGLTDSIKKQYCNDFKVIIKLPFRKDDRSSNDYNEYDDLIQSIKHKVKSELQI